MRARTKILAGLALSVSIALAGAAIGIAATSTVTARAVQTQKVVSDSGTTHLFFSGATNPTTTTVPGSSISVSVPSTWTKGALIVGRLSLDKVACMNAGDCELDIRTDGGDMLPDTDLPLSNGTNVQEHLYFERYVTVQSGPHTVEFTVTVLTGSDNFADITGWLLGVTVSRVR
jgi:hypothetical protein